MNQTVEWPDIKQVEQTDDTATLLLAIPTTLKYFAGHFHGMPVLPGIVQLHWAIHYARDYLTAVGPSIPKAEALKYQAIIQPGMELKLTLERKSADKIQFTYHGDGVTYSSGRLLFGSPSTNQAQTKGTDR